MRQAFHRLFPPGFSLVEVVLSLGILTFAVLMVLALVPFGLQTNRDTTEEGVAANIVRAMVSDWKAVGLTTNSSRLFQLPALSLSMVQTNTLGVGDDGNPTALATARYRVAYRIAPPPTASSFQPYTVDFTVYWPGQAAAAQGKFESVAALPSR